MNSNEISRIDARNSRVNDVTVSTLKIGYKYDVGDEVNFWRSDVTDQYLKPLSRIKKLPLYFRCLVLYIH